MKKSTRFNTGFPVRGPFVPEFKNDKNQGPPTGKFSIDPAHPFLCLYRTILSQIPSSEGVNSEPPIVILEGTHPFRAVFRLKPGTQFFGVPSEVGGQSKRNCSNGIRKHLIKANRPPLFAPKHARPRPCRRACAGRTRGRPWRPRRGAHSVHGRNAHHRSQVRCVESALQ